ncbi:helix-turn-helix domain-containing protein [Actinocrispum wychmicini]|uniref:Helix-turn-helix protein n=1 Tax=Actinocrispum wychmicini TaxID=1213861 RepID=A0A4R2JPZ9_9PSEU|nr:helix-turn-helix domain-containing protein [Actinocrispum wychmicini]TCO62273.1 helix-turn-helix protein [Actinocrispum wychmicini]
MARPERPLDPTTDDLQKFASELRELRQKAGSPGYRQLAKSAHYSVATLADAAGGRKLPSLAVTLAYVRACGGDDRQWEAKWRSLAVEQPPARSAPPEEAPYVGLASFQREDANRFFGRERLVAEVVGRIQDRRFVAVFGPSGSGKSSLLRAGVVPAMANWPVVLFTPGAHPLAELAAQVSGTDLLIVVDQFEEVFTHCADAEERAQFIAALVVAGRDGGSRTRVVLGIRADFYGHCTEHPELVEALRDGQAMVGPMDADELQAAVTLPAVGAGLRVETALVSRIVSEMIGRPGALPLMSHALVETWRRRRGTTLTLAGYQAAGGVEGALTQTAERVYTGLDGEQQRMAREIFVRLTALGDGTEDTRRRVQRTELDGADPATQFVLDAMAQARLITLAEDSVQIAHEALIRCWPRLHDWLTEDRDTLHVHRQLTDAARLWESLDRDPGALYRGTRLATARMRCRQAVLTPNEQRFLDASIAARDHELRAGRRRVRRLRTLVACLAVVVCVAVTSAVTAVSQGQAAQDQRQIAISRQLATKATTMAMAQPVEAALVAVEAFRQAPTVEARSILLSLQTALGNNDSPRIVVPFKDAVFSPDGRVFATVDANRGMTLWEASSGREIVVIRDDVYLWRFSADGRVLVTAAVGDSGRVTVRDTATGSVINSFTIGEPVVWATLSADGRTLAVNSQPVGKVALWDVFAGHQIAEFTDPSDTFGEMAFGPDGRTLAMTSVGRSGVGCCQVTLRDVGTGREIPTFTVPTSFIADMVFSPDGRTLLTSGQQSLYPTSPVEFWNVHTGREIATANAGHIASGAFSPDGRTVATVYQDRPQRAAGLVRLWNADNGQEVATITGYSGRVIAVAFAQDGTLAAAFDNGLIQRLDLNVDNVTASLCDRIHVTKDLWDRYLPDLPFQPTCH